MGKKTKKLKLFFYEAKISKSEALSLTPVYK